MIGLWWAPPAVYWTLVFSRARWTCAESTLCPRVPSGGELKVFRSTVVYTDTFLSFMKQLNINMHLMKSGYSAQWVLCRCCCCCVYNYRAVQWVIWWIGGGTGFSELPAERGGRILVNPFNFGGAFFVASEALRQSWGQIRKKWESHRTPVSCCWPRLSRSLLLGLRKPFASDKETAMYGICGKGLYTKGNTGGFIHCER